LDSLKDGARIDIKRKNSTGGKARRQPHLQQKIGIAEVVSPSSKPILLRRLQFSHPLNERQAEKEKTRKGQQPNGNRIAGHLAACE
jgi:hypothetical protein